MSSSIPKPDFQSSRSKRRSSIGQGAALSAASSTDSAAPDRDDACRSGETPKAPHRVVRGLRERVSGGVLLSHPLAGAVPSALKG